MEGSKNKKPVSTRRKILTGRHSIALRFWLAELSGGFETVLEKETRWNT